MRHNGIKLPTASLAQDHYHGVGLCPVLSVRYGRSAVYLYFDQRSTYIMLGLHACVCIVVVGLLYVFRSNSQTAHFTAVTIILWACGL
jgi:hypothetical protein